MKLKVNGRELCKECKVPDGFCKHTIEDIYKAKFNSDSPEHYIRRFLAISETEKNNAFEYSLRERNELKATINRLEQDLRGYKWLEKSLAKMIVSKN